MRNFYPPEGHDFVNSAEIRKIAAENWHLKEMKFLKDAVDFRVSVLEKLESHGALASSGYGWSVFVPELYHAESGRPLLPSLDYLLLSYPRPQKASSTIRIIRNELFGAGPALSLLTHDFVLNSDNECLFHVDAVPVNLLNVRSREEIGRNAVIFFFGQDKSGNDAIAVSENYVIDFCHSESIKGKFVNISPFGTSYCLEDKVAALELGREMLDLLVPIQPVMSTSPNEY